MAEAGIRLEFSDDVLPLTTVSEINTALRAVGAGMWLLDLGGVPDDIWR